PQWMIDALEFFESVEAGDAWVELLEVWAEFEKTMGYPDGKRISAKSRPEEVARWISGGRSYDKVPVPDSLDRYATQWKSWWTKLQPACRKSAKGWPLPQVCPDNDAEWDGLRRGGCNGFFIIVMALAIWASALDDESAEEFLEIVEDVTWVCSTLTETHPSGSKRGSSEESEESEEARPRKRARA
ncbi:hypothetical protein K466DRAFT_504802, partial [Polyporus arcularius HHB13444]